MKIIVHGKEYDYYDDNYLISELKDYNNDGKIIVDNLPYDRVLIIYNYLAGYSTMLMSEPFPTEELENQNAQINKSINKVNHMQEFLKKNGKEKESIEVMEKFIQTLLEYDKEYNKYGDMEVEEDNYGILR